MLLLQNVTRPRVALQYCAQRYHETGGTMLLLQSITRPLLRKMTAQSKRYDAFAILRIARQQARDTMLYCLFRGGRWPPMPLLAITGCCPAPAADGRKSAAALLYK